MSPAHHYVHGHTPSVLRTYDTRTAANSAAHLLPHLHPGTTVLDVGCGSGSITADLAALVAPGTVVGVDVSEDVLSAARERAAARGLDNVTFVPGDVAALGFADGTFDVVHAHQVLQHVTDPVGALREMRRVCRPGGSVAARDADYAAMAWYPPHPELDEWRALYGAVARGEGAEPDAGRRLLSWARAAGFDDVSAGASTWCYADPAGRRLWGGSWAERILESGTAERAVATGLATRADLQRISAGWRAWAGTDDGWFTILHGEIVCRA